MISVFYDIRKCNCIMVYKINTIINGLFLFILRWLLNDKHTDIAMEIKRWNENVQVGSLVFTVHKSSLMTFILTWQIEKIDMTKLWYNTV